MAVRAHMWRKSLVTSNKWKERSPTWVPIFSSNLNSSTVAHWFSVHCCFSALYM